MQIENIPFMSLSKLKKLEKRKQLRQAKRLQLPFKELSADKVKTINRSRSRSISMGFLKLKGHKEEEKKLESPRSGALREVKDTDTEYMSETGGSC